MNHLSLLKYLSTEDTGNEVGETFIEERKIRISATPTAKVSLNEAQEELEGDAVQSATKLLATMQSDPDQVTIPLVLD